MTVKSGKGYKIKLESGRLLPKVYSSRKAAQKRIAQMKRHSKRKR
jgi:hypothetical protein